MKDIIRKLVAEALEEAYEKKIIESEIEIEEPKNPKHGDFSTNIAMKSASLYKNAPRKIAENILANIKDSEGIIEKTEIAGLGFINFFIKEECWYPILKKIHEKGDLYGAFFFGKGKKIQIEFVSANPTGPLHVGHGRCAAIGDSLCALLSFCGFDVAKEYYINDAGRQITTLGRSVFLRYKELHKIGIDFPKDCYQGDYIKDLALNIKKKIRDTLLEKDEEEAIIFCAEYAADNILYGIKSDLADFGVEFDTWFSEKKLHDENKIESTIKKFKEKGFIYEEEGALWFRTTTFGDEKDRVVVRKNGDPTYFASDMAYHIDKYERGFDKAIDIWGADHHGYISRIKGLIEASEYKNKEFDVILVQLVNLIRGGTLVGMSTRAGEFVTLKEVIDEVGKDSARFLFLTRHYESPLDFDLDIAKKQDAQNPLYYVQYVHARISSIVRKREESGNEKKLSADEKILALLKEPEELAMIKAMARFPDTVKYAAKTMESHRVIFYLTDIASLFHTYYNKHKILTDNVELSEARIYLVYAVKIVIKVGLTLLGVDAPNSM